MLGAQWLWVRRQCDGDDQFKEEASLERPRQVVRQAPNIGLNCTFADRLKLVCLLQDVNVCLLVSGVVQTQALVERVECFACVDL